MQSFGFDVVSTGLVEEAERVLLDNSRREILVVLDDPLGSDFDKGSRAAQALQRLQSLVRRIQPSRRLIVSQSQEALLSVSDCNSLDEVQTGTLQWHDLGICPPSFLTKVWNAQSQSNQVTETVREAVEAAIASGEIDVPAGVLAHLAAYHQQLEGADVVRLAQNLASESAADFASRLRAGGMQQVMRALAIGSTAAETSADRELAFILGEGAELDMPSEHDYWSLSPDEKLVVPELAPAYEDEPRLPEDAKRRLISLEAYRVVRRKRPDHFEFSHPYYRSVARHFVKRVASLEKDDLLTAIRRGLFSPSASTSGATARNLWWLHHDLASRLDLGEPLVHLAEKGLRWHFPATRDLCYQFLLEVVKAKPESYEDKLQSWVNSMSRIRLDDVIWERGEPYFPVENQHTNLSFGRDVPAPDMARVALTVESLRSGAALPSPGRAVEILRYFKSRPSELVSEVLRRLLSYSEGLIRAEAALIWLLIERENDDEILERLQRDTHPSVVSRILDASIDTWNELSSGRKEKLVATLRSSHSEPETAAVAVLRLLNHFREADFEEPSKTASKPWELVGVVLAPALRRYPNSFRMIGHGFYPISTDGLKRAENFKSCRATLRRIRGL